MSIGKANKEDLYKIEDLIEQDNHSEALKRLIWFHEASRESEGLGGVRLSYAIESWLALGKSYPPAMTALIKLRDSNKETLLSGKCKFENFHDFAAINHYLESEEDTLMTFLSLYENDHNRSREFYAVVEDLLVKNKYYDVCAYYIKDPITKYRDIENAYKLQEEIAQTLPPETQGSFFKFMALTYTRSVCQLIEVMVAIDRMQDAKEVQMAALNHQENEEIEKALSL